MIELENKKIVIGVTGSIAAYKIAGLCSMLKKKKADVTVIMTQNATNFINPITFETLTGNKCLIDTFDRNFQYDVEHVELAKAAEVFLVAPASANVIAKAAHGIADDMLTTTLLAATCPKLFAPAMNTRMYQNPITQDNLQILKKYGMKVITPASGYLACGDTGEGKMPEVEELYDNIIDALTPKDLTGYNVLVTAGPTQEKIDPVRFISNHSTGKMGYAIAKQAKMRGAKVTLVSGPVALEAPKGVEVVPIVSAKDMADAVWERADTMDMIIKAAAVADYRPVTTYEDKVKKSSDDMGIALERTDDILAHLGKNKKEGQILCGFSMETKDMLENSKAKLEKKNLDVIVANNLKVAGAGFGTDTNVVTLITKDEVKELPILSKEEVADRILSFLLGLKD
ncbi:MAG: bifunctional phosphopantothenoylcysteine decarboxylase/phosphopantothenate--cysteine ligase CoaBC [Lachnospiraceae bacterium]|nr:bifunctional phosphopantothenoylcysteine decarboxylase/phosphopantothenate--cysteine ligase CoaBC [Lachnospiraceae bacterium]MDD5854339.1 bifunctional phosphopantothenoylcysteine decarboxylase/phosphopantothenate--cysteine ligase CoaBC [Lachnospiraceae bacterium]